MAVPSSARPVASSTWPCSMTKAPQVSSTRWGLVVSLLAEGPALPSHAPGCLRSRRALLSSAIVSQNHTRSSRGGPTASTLRLAALVTPTLRGTCLSATGISRELRWAGEAMPSAYALATRKALPVCTWQGCVPHFPGVGTHMTDAAPRNAGRPLSFTKKSEICSISDFFRSGYGDSYCLSAWQLLGSCQSHNWPSLTARATWGG